MTLTRDAFCSFCGSAFVPPLSYPRKCQQCGAQLWANPIPVSVALIPVRQGGRLGLLVVRRAIQPRQGFVALVGGFLEEHETWQQGAAREVREETGVEIDPASLLTFWFTSTEPRPNRVLLFSLGAEVDADSFSAFVPSHETSERGLVFGPEGLDSLFAFPLHAEAARRFFAKLGVQGPHEYTLV